MMGLISEIRTAAVAPGTIRVWWLGQQSWVLKTPRYTCYIDPYLTPRVKRNTPHFFTPAELTNADFILCTHDHSDHLDRPSIGGMMAASPQAKLILPAKAAATIAQDGVPLQRVIPLDGASHSRFAVSEFGVTAIPAKHEFFDYTPAHGYPYLQYLIEASGRCVYTAGDTLLYDGMLTRLRQFPRISLALVPINGRDAARYAHGCMGNMTWQEAADLCGELQPEVACPAHYEMFSDNSEDPQKFLDYCAVKYPGLNCQLLPAGGAMVL